MLMMRVVMRGLRGQEQFPLVALRVLRGRFQVLAQDPRVPGGDAE